MKLSIQTVLTSPFDIEVGNNATIAQVKEEIEKKQKIPQYMQHLIYKGIKLESETQVTKEMKTLTCLAPIAKDNFMYQDKEENKKFEKEKQSRLELKADKNPRNLIQDIVRQLQTFQPQSQGGGGPSQPPRRPNQLFQQLLQQQQQQQQPQRRRQPPRQVYNRPMPSTQQLEQHLDQDIIGMMTAMGMPRKAVIKALFICGGDGNAASEWLLNRDAQLEALTDITPQQYFRATLHFPDTPVEEACDNGQCSASVTRNSVAFQTRFSCTTCGAGNICRACAETCHADHETRTEGRGQFYCACGTNEMEHTCQANNTSNE